MLTPLASAFSNTGLTANTSYTYTISAIDSTGNESQTSSPVSLTTTPPVGDTTDPTIPSLCLASANTFDQVTFSCTASSDNVAVTSYVTQRCSGVSCTPTVQVDTHVDPRHISRNLTASTIYGFRMAARDAVGNESAFSTVVYATTPAVPPPTPATILLLNNDVQDASGQGHHGTATAITFDATNTREGSHAGIWNASTDQITVPMTAFTNPNQLTFVANVRPTAFAGRKFHLRPYDGAPLCEHDPALRQCHRHAPTGAGEYRGVQP